MTVHCFTSCSFSYLAKARTLGFSLKRFHPDWHLTLCLTDREPEGFRFGLDDEPFDSIIWSDELPIDNPKGWLFKHEVVEACTAVKGPALKLLTETDAEKIFYLDPDVAVFAPLTPMLEMLDNASILLTPHQLTPEEQGDAIIDNEICSLAHGTYNLGFLAIRNDANGRALAEWWNERLLEYCFDDKTNGIFVDQKWCDLVPAMFEGVMIVRDPGYNVASWNLSNRTVAIGADGAVRVNDSPLRFFHFTKLGPIGDTMTRKYAQDNVEVYELWSWYKRMVDGFAEPRIPPGFWHFGRFANGAPIPRASRLLYRERADLRAAFPDPFAAGDGSYFEWLRAEGQLG